MLQSYTPVGVENLVDPHRCQFYQTFTLPLEEIITE